MKAYRIRHWSQHYETSNTRKLKRMTYVTLPNRHDGAGYRRIVVTDEEALRAACIG